MFSCLYIPDFPVEAVLRAEPDLREQAVAVLDGTPPLVRVVAVNDRARQAGVEVGMTALEAEALPSLQRRRRSPAQEAAAHAALLDCAAAFSPRIEDTAADTIVLDLAGLERLFGPPARIARDLARRASDVGLECHVAVAANPDAAAHAARGFPGVTLIPDGREAERLGELSVDLLAPSPALLETLDRWGVRTFHNLAVLPEVAVAERLGQIGIELQRLARGAVHRTLVPAEPPLVFEEAVELEHPIDLLEPLAFVLNRMLEQLCARLSARALATNELRLRLALDRSPDADAFERETRNEKRETAFERTLRLPVPLQDAKVFLKLLQLDLKAHPPGAPIAKIWLAAEPVKPRSAQSGLFLPVAPEPEKLELTVARLNGIVGEGHVGSPQLLDTYRPDPHRMVAFSAAPHVPASATRNSKPEIRNLLAFRRFRPPVAAFVELGSGRPMRLAFDGSRVVVLSASGPWRTSGEWWSDDATVTAGKLGTSEKDYGWNRDEWDVAVLARPSSDPAPAPITERVVLYRIFFDRKCDRWFVEGTYD